MQEFDPVVVAELPENQRSVQRFAAALAAALVATIMAMSLLKIDIVTRFDGQIAPRGGTVKIVSLGSGVVSKVHALNGALVKKGDLILSFDDSELVAELDIHAIEVKELQHKLEEVQSLERAVNQNSLELSEAQASNLIRGISQLAKQARMTSAGNGGSLAEFRDRLLSMHETYLRLGSECLERKRNLERLKDLEAIKLRRFSALREGAMQAVVSKMQLLEAEEALIDVRQEAAIGEARLNTALRSRTEHYAKLVLLISESRRTWRSSIADYESRLSVLNRRIESTRHALSQLEMRSPLDGVVQDVEVQHAGVRIPEGTVIANVVPVNRPIVVEGRLNNRDVPYVESGLPVRVKVEAFPHTIYGVLTGHVQFVARNNDGPMGGQQYKVFVDLDDEPSGRTDALPLLPGLKVSAEVITGKRRLVEYFYGAAVRAVDGAFNER